MPSQAEQVVRDRTPRVAGSDSPEAREVERAFVEALRCGEEQAFERLVRECSPRMLAVARRLLGCEADAQDAVQEAFLSAFRAIAGFDQASRLATWLHRITVNVCLMKLRSRRRRPELPIEALLPTYIEDGHRVVGGRVAPADAAGERSEAELRSHVRECIDRLEAPYREVLLLRDLVQLDTLETSLTLGISEAAVKARLHRARQALRCLLLSEAVSGAEPFSAA